MPNYQIGTLALQHIMGTRNFVIFGREVNELCGNNASAKTSTLAAIEWIFAGKNIKKFPEILNHGAVIGQGSCALNTVENGAIIEIDSIVVTKTVDSDGKETLVAKTKEGRNVTQTKLKNILDKLTFDPTSFDKLSDDKQEAILSKLCGPKFCKELNEINDRLEHAEKDRLVLGREVREKGELALVEKVEPVDTMALMKELEEAQTFNGQIEKSNSEEEKLRGKIETKKAKLAELEKEFYNKTCEIKTELMVDEERFQNWPKPTAKKDVTAIHVRIAQAGEISVKAQLYANHQAELQARIKLNKRYEKAQSDVKQFQSDRKNHTKKASLPVDGITWGPDGLRKDGVLWKIVSKGERLVASVKLSAASNPSLKIMIIHESECLDNPNFRAVLAEMLEAGYQVWIEKVGEGRTEEAIYMKGGGIDEEYGYLKKNKIAYNKETEINSLEIAKKGGGKTAIEDSSTVDPKDEEF